MIVVMLSLVVAVIIRVVVVLTCFVGCHTWTLTIIACAAVTICSCRLAPLVRSTRDFVGRRGRSGCVVIVLVVVILVTVGPSAESLSAQSVSLEMTNEKVLTDKGAIALIAAEDACLIVIELVAQEVVGS